jgi:hypothetical protein
MVVEKVARVEDSEEGYTGINTCFEWLCGSIIVVLIVISSCNCAVNPMLHYHLRPSPARSFEARPCKVKLRELTEMENWSARHRLGTSTDSVCCLPIKQNSFPSAK